MDEHKEAIEKVLAEFWDERSLDDDEDPSTVGSLVDHLESIAAVDVLLRVKKVIGIEIDEEHVIRRGGYDTRDQFVSELTAAILKHAAEHAK